MENGQVVIRKRGADRFRGGHLWVYKSDIVNNKDAPPGGILSVRDERGTVAEELAVLGLIVEGFGPGAMMVREAPAAIAQGDLSALVRDLAADLAAEDGAQTLARRLDQRLATFACHHSVRSGRPLKPEEMNALLRAMEATPGAGQCNHGRPTYVELKLTDIERLFGRR